MTSTDSPTAADSPSSRSSIVETLFVLTGFVAIVSALYIEWNFNDPEQVPIALVGPLLAGLVLALTLGVYNRYQQSQLAGQGNRHSEYIATLEDEVEAQQVRIQALESRLETLQSTKHSASSSGSPQGAAGHQPTGSRNAEADTKAREVASPSEAEPVEPASGEYSQSAHLEDKVERVDVSATAPEE
jgi:hypothetical protein